MDETPHKPALEMPGQLKGWFHRQPAAPHPLGSEHLGHGARENEQLAELIGQVQSLLDLARFSVGRPPYPPTVATLDTLTAATVTLPAEAHTIEAVQLSTDTATVCTVTLNDPHAPGGGRVIARIVAPVGVTAPIPVNCAVPPIRNSNNGGTLSLTLAPAPAHGSLHVLLTPQAPGGYPYAG